MFSDRGFRPPTPQAEEGRHRQRRRIGFDRGEPVIEIFDTVPQAEADKYFEALKTNADRDRGNYE